MSTSPSGGLNPSSKKIKKSSPSIASNKDSKDASKKYKTFDNLQREKILSDLRQGVISILKLDPSHEALYDKNFLKLLGRIGIDEYNRLLKEIIFQKHEDFASSNKAYTQWRKKIKNWILNSGKPERRGGPIVTDKKADRFRARVIGILNSLSFKSFSILKSKILVVLEEFHNEAQNPSNPKPFNKKTCSKHWWFNFMVKNPDIKAMWENLPLTARTCCYKDAETSLDSSQDDIVSNEPSTDASSPFEEIHEVSPCKEEEEMWVEPCLKNLSGDDLLGEFYGQNFSILEESPVEEMVQYSYNMKDEKEWKDMFEFDFTILPQTCSYLFMLGDDTKFEFEREEDGVGQHFSELYNNTFKQGSRTRRSDTFCLFRTQAL